MAAGLFFFSFRDICELSWFKRRQISQRKTKKRKNSEKPVLPLLAWKKSVLQPWGPYPCGSAVTVECRSGTSVLSKVQSLNHREILVISLHWYWHTSWFMTTFSCVPQQTLEESTKMPFRWRLAKIYGRATVLSQQINFERFIRQLSLMPRCFFAGSADINSEVVVKILRWCTDGCRFGLSFCSLVWSSTIRWK